MPNVLGDLHERHSGCLLEWVESVGAESFHETPRNYVSGKLPTYRDFDSIDVGSSVPTICFSAWERVTPSDVSYMYLGEVNPIVLMHSSVLDLLESDRAAHEFSALTRASASSSGQSDRCLERLGPEVES